MNDDFLYRFRAEPSAEFAARLKARLDASGSARKRGVQWGVFTLIFGAALAFALPAVRESISRFVGVETRSEHVTIAPAAARPESPATSSAKLARPPESPASPANLPDARASAPRGAPARSPASAQTQPRTWKQYSRMNPVTRGDFGFVASAPPLPSFERDRGRDDSVPHSSTQLDEAHDAIVLRRSVFRVMGWATDDLGRRVYDGASENYDAIAADARRLRELTAMIPEVFERDTRDIVVDTRALPGIWLNPGAFQQEVALLQTDLEMLERAARARRFMPTLEGIKSVVASCDRCHDVFRRNDPPGSTQ